MSSLPPGNTPHLNSAPYRFIHLTSQRYRHQSTVKQTPFKRQHSFQHTNYVAVHIKQNTVCEQMCTTKLKLLPVHIFFIEPAMTKCVPALLLNSIVLKTLRAEPKAKFKHVFLLSPEKWLQWKV